MNRRSFLKLVVGSAVAVVLPSPKPEMPAPKSLRDDVVILPADDPKKMKMGWVIHEEIGIVVLNDYAIAKIQIT